MKLWILIFSFWYTSQALAVTCPDGNCPTDSVVEPSEMAKRVFIFDLYRQTAPPPETQITTVLADLGIVGKYTPHQDYRPTKCDKFVSKNKYGEWGALMAKDFKDKKYAALLAGSPDVIKSCPNYPILPEDYKIAVRVLERTMHARFESTCQEHVTVPGINGPATGLFQLYKGNEAMYAPGQCRNGDGSEANRSIRCTSAMEDNLAKKGKPIYDVDSHWAVLETHNLNIPDGFKENAALVTMAAVCDIPFCGGVSSYCDEVHKAAESGAKSLHAKSSSKSRKRVRVAQARSAR
jgi:hypothetical protein